MSFKTNFRHISMTLFVFCLPIILFIAILITSYFKTTDLQWSNSASKSALYFGLVCLITLPGFLLHYNHYQHDKGKTLNVGATFFELTSPTKYQKIYYKDIQKVERHSLLWNKKLPWNDYSYIQITLHNGERVKITGLLNYSALMDAVFNNNPIIVEHLQDFYTWVNIKGC